MLIQGKHLARTNVLQGINRLISKLKNRRIITFVSIISLSSLLLTSCSGASAVLPNPNINIYLLDLTGSGNVDNQFRLIKEDLVQDLASESLGSPNSQTGPSLTKFYFVGTNSRALREFTLQDINGVYELFQYVKDENNNTREEKFWRLLTEKYRNYVSQKLEYEESISKQSCLNDFNEIFMPTWSSERVREVYSIFMCRLATYTLTNFYELQNYINSESMPGVQKASDVFGALSKIDSQIRKYRKEFKNSKIKVTLATDGDHNLGANSESNLRARIETSSDICALANEYKSEFALDKLKESKKLKIDPRGISALTKRAGEYPRKLEQFWNCFFPNT